ncbi:uncharacterized protein LOC134244633, partial [Saccostrea cucullata]|uniref:uncharacterized protein LOC134244633 n=1 Tax=Saccostrea cuccullata TaxID=36930 RepID=UPI002ED075B6
MVIQNLYNEHKYLLSMNISQCYEPDNCDVHHVLFKNSLIPKAVCDWSRDFQIKGFSLYVWKLEKGVNMSINEIEDPYIPQLMEELGIASYSRKPMCTITPDNSSGRIQGWKTGCAMNVSLPTLDPSVNCDLLLTCTGVRCCVHASLLKRNYEISFNIDHCTSSLSIQIEQVFHNQTLDGFLWGNAYEFKLLGVYRIRYIVYDLPEEDVYLLSLDVMDCYESINPQCSTTATFTVFNKVAIPKAQCSWDRSYRIQNFSLQSWLFENKLENATDLIDNEYKLAKLLDELALSQYLETICRLTSPTSSFGWTSSCTKSVSRPSIPEGLCHLLEDCTSVECCFNVDFLRHNFRVFLTIDPCNANLHIGVEKLKREISLVDYPFGKLEHLWLGGVVRLDFMLEDLYGERLYLVNMNVSFCFESAGECYKSIAVFKETLLPKQICPWNQTSGFSLSAWRRQHSVPFGIPLNTWTKALLLEHLDIAQYRESNECIRGKGYYTCTNYGGVGTGFNLNASRIPQLCQLAVDLENNPMTIDSARRVTCYVPSLCTAVDCCVDVPSLDMSFHTYISIDPCQYMLKIGIEKYSFQRSLDQLRFEYHVIIVGQEEVFTLSGIVKMVYKIEDLPAEKLYVMSVKLSVCTETSGCEANHTIFNNMLLPKQPCQWNEGFINLNFSGSAWMTNNGYTTPLSESQSAELMKEVRAARYLLPDSCNLESSVNGWNNYCPKEMSLTNLTGSSISCHIPYLCNEIQCCVRAENIRRSFQVVVSLDPCSQIMLIKLERLTIKVDLLEFKFGTKHHYNLVGLLRADLKLYDLQYQRKYMIDLEIRVCFESNGTCDFISTALNNTLLPKTKCDWSSGLEGFSLESWLLTKGESIGSVSLPEHVQYMLLEERGIANMMKDTPCSRTGDTMYNSSTPVNGWRTDCTSSTSNLTELPSEITCYYHGSCTAVSCCMDIVKFDNRSIEVSIIFDECANFLTLTIERISQTVYLHEFSYGTEQKMTLKGIFELKYTITQNVLFQKYEFMVDIFACYEPLYCDQVITILNQTSFDMKNCTYQEGFLNSSFSLSAWLASRAIPHVEDMTVPQASDLLTELGLDHFLDSTDRCSLSDTVYGAAAENGWNNECEKFPNYTLPTIPNKNEVLCHILSTCDRVSCCVYIAPVQRHVEMKLILNTCSYQLEAMLDNVKITRNMFKYTWDTMEKIGIHGVVSFEFHVTNVVSERKMRIDGNIKLCFEQNNCTEVLIFHDLPISHSVCNVSSGETAIEGISFDFWRQTECEANLFDPAACNETQIEGIPLAMQKYCKYLSDCSGLECCFENEFSLGNRSLYFMVRLDCDHLVFQIENKKVQKSLKALSNDVEYREPIGNPTAFQFNYTVLNHSTNYRYGVGVVLLVRESKPTSAGIIIYNVMLSNTTRVMPQGCGTSRRRRKRRSVDISQLDTEKLTDGIRALLESDAPNNKFEEFWQRIIEKNKLEKAQNLAATLLSSDDVTTGIKSQIQALGSGNPFTIKTTEDNAPSVTVQGGAAIADVLVTLNSIPGRSHQSYIVGSGVTQYGAKLLGNKLACMTIGDLESLLSLKNIDPVKVALLLKDMQDLSKALYSEFISKLFTDGARIFKNFEVYLKEDFSFPRQHGSFFSFSKTFLVGGFITVNFGFGVDYYFGVKFSVDAKLLEMKGAVTTEPYGGLMVWGELGFGFLLYAKLRLEGHIMDTGFPIIAEVDFLKFPIDVTLTMYLRLTPLKLRLYALVTLEVDLWVYTLRMTLFKAKLWQYETPSIRLKLIDNKKDEKDNTPPKLLSFGGKTPAGSCGVEQVAGRDHTAPEFTINVMAEDDRSNVNLHLDIGTVPGGSNVMSRKQLGGFSTALNDVLRPAGVPLYFTIHVSNEAGVSVPASCKLNTYDMTIPGGRMAEAFTSTSNPNVLKAVVTVYEDSPLTETKVAVGYGRSIWGEQIIRWTTVSLADNAVNYDVGHDPLNQKVIKLFSSGKTGRLVGRGIKAAEDFEITTKEECAKKCNAMHVTKCLSFNYDYGSSGHCELLEAIEGHDHKISRDGHYMHFEKLGVGSNRGFVYENVQLPHNQIIYFNFHAVNSLGFENILSSKPIITDYTPPDPTSWQINITSDKSETIKCEDVIPDDRDDWEERFCEGVNPKTKNHRIIIDGEGSETVYNGHTYKNDLKYTRANRYISANWDGIYDNETGILGYSVTAGESICEEKIKQHHDPHAHLFDRSQWTHSVMMSPLEEPYTVLP